MSNCGCNDNPKKPSKPSGSFWLVEATGKNATQCGTPSDSLPGSSACDLSEPTHDTLQAEFAFPAENSVEILVCDGSLYSVGQWIHFVGAKATVQILSINGNTMTVRAVCANGAIVDGNPTAGTIIAVNNAIVPVQAPPCLTDDQRTQKIFDDLAQAQEFCLPELQEQASTTAEIQPVGWTKSDSGDSNFKKCIRRIKGVFFKNGRPHLTSLRTTDLSEATGHRGLVLNKATGEVKERLNYSEESSLEEDVKYVLGILNGNEAFVPGYVFTPIGEQIQTHGGSFEDPDSWANNPEGTPYTHSLNLNIAKVNDLNIQSDTFYAKFHILFGSRNLNNRVHKSILKIDDVIMSGAYGYYHVDYDMKGFEITAPVSRATKLATLKVESSSDTSDTCQIHVTTRLVGLFY